MQSNNKKTSPNRSITRDCGPVGLNKAIRTKPCRSSQQLCNQKVINWKPLYIVSGPTTTGCIATAPLILYHFSRDFVFLLTYRNSTGVGSTVWTWVFCVTWVSLCPYSQKVRQKMESRRLAMTEEMRGKHVTSACWKAAISGLRRHR